MSMYYLFRKEYIDKLNEKQLKRLKKLLKPEDFNAKRKENTRNYNV